MAANNNENTANANATENKDKSLFSKAKDTLVNIKDQVKDLLTENNNENDIQGMSKGKFEKTKAELESSLHFKQQDEQQQQAESLTAVSNQQVENRAEFQSQSGAEVVQNQSKWSSDNMKTEYKRVDQQEFVQAPEVLLQETTVVDDKKDELKYSDQNETHVLPTIRVQEKPIIIEKEIEFEKPVEIKQTIIHKEKPVIIEKPTIIEKHENYRDTTEYQRNDQKIVKESISEQHVGNQDQEALLNLRKERIENFSDTAPIIKHEKQQVQLDTEVREQPAQVYEKEVVYQQPVEIERKKIEKIKPVVREEVTLNKEHIHEKVAPEVYQTSPQVIEKEKYFSQDTTATSTAASTTAASTAATTATADTAAAVDTTLDNNNDVSSFNAGGVAREEKQKREIM